MLVVYDQQLEIPQQQLLLEWRLWVHYWPRSVSMRGLDSATALDWYLLFSHPLYGMQWMLRWPEHSRVIRSWA